MNFKVITIIISIIIVLISIIKVESISITNLNAMKDVEFTVFHEEDTGLACTILFKPKLIPQSSNSISTIDSINYKKAVQVKCKNTLTKEKRTEYQKSCHLFKTTVLSDKEPDNISFSSLPKSTLNDSSLQYEFLKINLDSNLNLIASNYQLKKASPISKENEEKSTSLFVLFEFPEDVLKLVYDEPKVEKEKEKEKEKEESQSFIGKYWFYLLPLFLIMVVNMINPPAAQTVTQANTANAAAKK